MRVAEEGESVSNPCQDQMSAFSESDHSNNFANQSEHEAVNHRPMLEASKLEQDLLSLYSVD